MREEWKTAGLKGRRDGESWPQSLTRRGYFSAALGRKLVLLIGSAILLSPSRSLSSPPVTTLLICPWSTLGSV